jgi:glycerol-3-phosphate dehydrogenase
MDDIRLCLDNALSAYNAGAIVSNKTEAVGFIKDKGRITGIEARDKLSGEQFLIRAGIVINATGAWSNRIVKLDDPASPDITRPTKGIHIVYKRLPHERAILLSARKDKRVFFVIPWRGYTLIGTTDTDYVGPADKVYANADDVEYLLQEAGRIFGTENLERKGIITTFAGLRPLVNRQGKPAWQVSREHLIRESPSGLFSVVGGKYTTYRHLAEEAVDLALATIKGRNFKECFTHTVGPSTSTSEVNKADLHNLIEHAVKEEMANSLNDLLVRRLQLSIAPEHGFDCLKECADIMAALLGWTDAKKAEEIRLYKEEVRENMNF